MNGKISETKMKRKWNKKSEKRCRITAKEESSISISRLTHDVPSPAQADKGASWCEWWSRTAMVGAPGPRRWPGSQRSSQAGCVRSDRSARTLWPLWIQCGWPLQTEQQHLWMKGKSFISVSLLEAIYMEQNGKDGVSDPQKKFKFTCIYRI